MIDSGWGRAENEAVRKQVCWGLVEYGVDHLDRRFDEAPLSALMDWSLRERGAFRRQEQVWWEANLSQEATQIVTDGIDRYSLGGKQTYPFITRPFDYGVYSQYPELNIATSRTLIDRGLAVARDAESRHFLLLAGIERELAFSLALDIVSQQRLLQFSKQLRTNRPDAETLMGEHWGELPPSRGQEYDAMPFTIAERQIAAAYRRRNDDTAALHQAVRYCREMIDRSAEFVALFSNLGQPLPNHKGFQQLAIILNKQGQVGEALQLSRQANVEGWDGDWNARIARYTRRLEKKEG